MGYTWVSLTLLVCRQQEATCLSSLCDHTFMLSPRPGAKRPFLRSQRPPPRITKPQPKGVMLRFNFRAMANQVEERRGDWPHPAPHRSPVAWFWGCQLGLSSTTQEDSPTASLAWVLTKMAAPEKTIWQQQTHPCYSCSVGPSCPICVLLGVGRCSLGAGLAGGSHVTSGAPPSSERCSTSGLCSLFALEDFSVPHFSCFTPRALGRVRNPVPPSFVASSPCLDGLFAPDTLCSHAICLLLFLPRTPSLWGLGTAWRFFGRTQSVELLVSV